MKTVVSDFVAARADDRVGLVLFAARPYTQCPLTLDASMLVATVAIVALMVWKP